MLLAVGESAPKATRFRVWLANSRVTPTWGSVKLLEKYWAGPDYLDVTVEGNGSPGATVTITNIENGLKRSVKTDDSGRFSFPQLKPGTYSVKAEADRFEAQQNNTVSAGLGQKQAVDFKLNIASTSENILVQEQGPLINPENLNTSTTLNARAIETLPNPGGDMTYPLQFAPGALINTAGSGNDFVGGTNGYGNVEFNGLPSLSNGYTGLVSSMLSCNLTQIIVR